ncbi:MAG: Stage V sporulation protein B [Candidatus Dichloromethanomonas elyunquensis]|nr:MAG: Stage V sporulation protein B [Candidatus Dichloromethanomonas elyunquensis]
MRSNNLIYGAVILFTANLINRILGFGYQYLIMHYIGSESFGLYYMVFPVYMTALVLTTAGIPLAISKMVSEKVSVGSYGDVQKIFRIALLILFVSGLFVSVILYIFSPVIVGLFLPDKRVFAVFRICIPAIFIVSVSSGFRGYFQGLQNMIPSALSQVCEQIIRVAVGFTLSLKLLPQGVEWAAAGLAAGMLCGEAAGFSVILLQYLLKRSERNNIRHFSHESAKSIIWNLVTISLPVTGGRLMSTGLSALDAVIIPKQLQAAGYSARSAASLFGQLGGTALTLLTFPSVFTFALATSLVPAISEAIGRKDYQLAQKRCSDAIRYTIILGLPCVITLYYYAQPLTQIFKSGEVANVLKVLAIGGIFAYLQQTTTGILQGLGKTFLPLFHSIISTLFRLPLLYYLTGVPVLGLLGSSFAYVFGFVCLAILNLLAVKRNLKMKFDLRSILLQPGSAGLGMILILNIFLRFTHHTAITNFTSMILGLTFYVAILLLNGGINTKEIGKIPLLNRIFH